MSSSPRHGHVPGPAALLHHPDQLSLLWRRGVRILEIGVSKSAEEESVNGGLTMPSNEEMLVALACLTARAGAAGGSGLAAAYGT